METIKIILQGDRYMAYFVADKLLLPTPFSPRQFAIEEVVELIRQKNPGCYVTFERYL